MTENNINRKKIKLLIALNGWKIRCRMVWVYDTEMQYAWFEDSDGNSLTKLMPQELRDAAYRYTRTQAINSLIDTWYKLNKHTLEQ
jgi:hypothetical protein